MVLQKNRNWKCENEKIDSYIQEMQLKYCSSKYLFEWIPYAQFNSIEKIDRNDFATIYSATWMDGPLSYYYGELIRDSNKKVALKYLNQNIVDEILNEV
jgi:hypothetical protein